jgi:hypothetical protein
MENFEISKQMCSRTLLRKALHTSLSVKDLVLGFTVFAVVCKKKLIHFSAQIL